jgi:hypothetical protein
VLARAGDAALFVVRHGHTAAADVTDALAALRAVSARVLGCTFSKGPKPSRATRSRTDYSAVHRSQPNPATRPDTDDGKPVSPSAKTSPVPELTMAAPSSNNQAPHDPDR